MNKLNGHRNIMNGKKIECAPTDKTQSRHKITTNKN